MDQKGLITRQRSATDERSVIISLTDKGRALRDRALSIPEKLGSCIKIDAGEARQLYALLYKLLGELDG